MVSYKDMSKHIKKVSDKEKIVTYKETEHLELSREFIEEAIVEKLKQYGYRVNTDALAFKIDIVRDVSRFVPISYTVLKSVKVDLSGDDDDE